MNRGFMLILTFFCALGTMIIVWLIYQPADIKDLYEAKRRLESIILCQRAITRKDTEEKSLLQIASRIRDRRVEEGSLASAESIQTAIQDRSDGWHRRQVEILKMNYESLPTAPGVKQSAATQPLRNWKISAAPNARDAGEAKISTLGSGP